MMARKRNEKLIVYFEIFSKFNRRRLIYRNYSNRHRINGIYNKHIRSYSSNFWPKQKQQCYQVHYRYVSNSCWIKSTIVRWKCFFLSLFVAQVKLDVDVSMTPEMEVTSTVASGNSNNSSDSDQSNEIPMGATLSTVSLNSSTANIHPNIENQFKVSEV